jgi:hypothetical protein
VEVVEYWTKDWHAVKVKGGEILYVEKNSYGFVPFKHAFAGIGSDRSGEDGSNPEFLAVGIMDAVQDAVVREAQEVSAKHNAVIEASFKRIRTDKDPAEAARELRGDIVQATRDEYGFIEARDVPQWVLQIGGETRSDIERGTFTSQVAGFRAEGVSTVGQQAILSSAASQKFAQPMRQLEHLVTLVGSDILRLVHVLDEPLTVRGYKIGKREVADDFNILVTYELIDPHLRLQERRMGIEEVKMGIKSMETYRSADARIEDETGERHRLLVEQLRKNPAIIEALASEVLKAEGLDKMVEKFLEGQREGDEPPIVNPDATGTPASPEAGLGDTAGVGSPRSAIQMGADVSSAFSG